MTIYQKKNKETGKVEGYYYSTYYKDVFGNSKRKMSKTFAKKKEAELAELEFKQSVFQANNGYSEITMREFLDKIFYPERQRQLKTSSFYSMRNALEHSAVPYFANMKLKDINVAQIREWYHVSLKDSSVINRNQQLSFLSRVFKYAMNYNIIPADPTTRIARDKKPIKINEDGEVFNPLDMVWTEDEFKLFLAKFREVNKDSKYMLTYYILMNVLYYTGLRLGEGLALKIKDIDLVNQSLVVNKAISNHSKEVVTPKTKNSFRKVYFNSSLAKLLSHYIENLKQYAEFGPDAFLFGLSSPCRHNSVNRMFIETRNKCPDLKPIRIHDFRHSRASYLISNGYNIAFVSRQMGHANITTTLNIYTTIMKDVEQNQIDLIKK